MEQMLSAGVIVYALENDTVFYLLLCHAAGHWDFPKGKMEPGETKKETALRELCEETGLPTVSLDDAFEESCSYSFLTYDKTIVQKTVYFFLGRIASGQTVVLSHEHIDFKWLSYKDAYDQLTHQHSKNILKKAQKQINHSGENSL